MENRKEVRLYLYFFNNFENFSEKIIYERFSRYEAPNIYELAGHIGIGGFDMVESYILLTSAIGKVRDVYDELSTLDHVKDVRIVTGPFDIIALTEAEDLSVLTSAVVEKIRDIEGVVDTNTAVVVE